MNNDSHCVCMFAADAHAELDFCILEDNDNVICFLASMIQTLNGNKDSIFSENCALINTLKVRLILK